MTENCRICEPVEGDFSKSGESRRNWLYVRSKFCGNIWTQDECLNEKTALVETEFYAYMCELENLRQFDRIAVTAASEGCEDPSVVDYCGILDQLRSTSAFES